MLGSMVSLQVSVVPEVQTIEGCSAGAELLLGFGMLGFGMLGIGIGNYPPVIRYSHFSR